VERVGVDLVVVLLSPPPPAANTGTIGGAAISAVKKTATLATLIADLIMRASCFAE
jgi:hypothetical protein